MKTIWKFELPITDTPSIEVPIGAQFLPTVAPADDPRRLWLWAVVNTQADTEIRTFHVVGTGNFLTRVGRYLGTAATRHEFSRLVWHVFEED